MRSPGAAVAGHERTTAARAPERMARLGPGAQVEAACAAGADAQVPEIPEGQAAQQAERAGSIFTDVMTSDLLVHFLRGRAFFRVAILSHELRSAAKVLALAYQDKTANAWRLLQAPAYHTQCKGCMKYVLRADLLPPVQHVCTPHATLPAWKLMLNPSTCRSHLVASGFSKRTRPRAERAGGQPLGRLTSGFLHLKALEPPYNPPREAPLKIRLRRSRRL